jgi:hypothetical protein
MSSDTFRYERSTTIAADAARIAPLITDFHAWTKWSPWDKTDPAMQRDYSGEPSGVGARYAWSGKKSGAGSMRIDEVTPSKVSIALEFTRPFKASNIAEFTFAPAAGGTRVTWVMSGPKNLVSKIFGLFMNMDKMIGKDFEAGLAALKSVVESKA